MPSHDDESVRTPVATPITSEDGELLLRCAREARTAFASIEFRLASSRDAGEVEPAVALALAFVLFELWVKEQNGRALLLGLRLGATPMRDLRHALPAAAFLDLMWSGDGFTDGQLRRVLTVEQGGG